MTTTMTTVSSGNIGIVLRMHVNNAHISQLKIISKAFADRTGNGWELRIVVFGKWKLQRVAVIGMDRKTVRR